MVASTRNAVDRSGGDGAPFSPSGPRRLRAPSESIGGLRDMTEPSGTELAGPPPADRAREELPGPPSKSHRDRPRTVGLGCPREIGPPPAPPSRGEVCMTFLIDGAVYMLIIRLDTVATADGAGRCATGAVLGGVPRGGGGSGRGFGGDVGRCSGCPREEGHDDWVGSRDQRPGHSRGWPGRGLGRDGHRRRGEVRHHALLWPWTSTTTP